MCAAAKGGGMVGGENQYPVCSSEGRKRVEDEIIVENQLTKGGWMGVDESMLLTALRLSIKCVVWVGRGKLLDLYEILMKILF